MEIRQATPEEIEAFYPKNPMFPIEAHGAFVDGKPIAMAGILREPLYYGTLVEDLGGLIGFLDVREKTDGLGANAIRAIRRWLRDRNETITVQCDDGFPGAERLLRLLGFQPTEDKRADEREKGQRLRMWTWQRSQR